MLLAKKCQYANFSFIYIWSNKTRNIADFAEKKETSLTIKKHNYLKFK